MNTYDADAKIRAYLDDRDISDEQRTIEARKRAILGSSDDCYALNVHESDRGSADTLALIGFTVALLGVILGIRFPVIGWSALGFIVVWVAVSIPFAVYVGRRIGGRS